jgi:hypothetical protein
MIGTRLIATAAVVIFLVFASIASASKLRGVVVKSKRSDAFPAEVAHNSFPSAKFVQRRCPRHKAALAAGLDWNAGNRSVTALYIDDISPPPTGSHPHRWEVIGASDEDATAVGHPIKFRASVTCAKLPKANISLAVSTGAFPEDQAEHNGFPEARGTNLFCRTNKQTLLSAGIFWPLNPAAQTAAYLSEWAPTPHQQGFDGVMTGVSDEDSPFAGSSYRYAATAVCAKGLHGVRVVKKRSHTFPAQIAHNGYPDRRAVSVRCKHGKVALGPGLSWNRSSSTVTALYASEFAPIVKHRKPVGYRIAGASDEDPGSVGKIFFRASVVCVPAA